MTHFENIFESIVAFDLNIKNVLIFLKENYLRKYRNPLNPGAAPKARNSLKRRRF